jgi:hypothetical protein
MAKQTPTQQTPTPRPPKVAPACPLLSDMEASPAGDWAISDVETLCGQIGLGFKAPRRGSHYKVFSKHLPGILTIPAHKPIKPFYVRMWDCPGKC